MYSSGLGKALALFLAIAGLAFFHTASFASDPVRKSSGHTVYVPVYSHIYIGSQGQEFLLASTLSVRNTSVTKPITLESVTYHDTAGKLLKKMTGAPLRLEALNAAEYFIGESDTAGGFGAFFLVKWSAEARVNEPIVEVVNVGARSGQGISFISPGRPIE